MPACDMAGTPGAAGSVRWLSHLDTWGCLLGCAHKAPGGRNFTLGNGRSRNARVCPPTRGRWPVLAAACETAQAPGGRRASGGLWLIHGKRVGRLHPTSHTEGRTQQVEWKESEAEGLAPSVLQTRPSWPEALAFSAGEEPREGCLPRCCCAAVKTACTEQVWDVLLPVSTPGFSLKRFPQPLGKESSCVFTLRDEVQDVQILSGPLHRENAPPSRKSCPATLRWR